MKIEKIGKRVTILYNKTEQVIHIINLKQTLNHGLITKKFHTGIKFNQNASLKPYFDMNIDLTKKAKNYFEKYFFKLMNHEIFGKTMENVRSHGDIKLVTTKRRKSYLVLEPRDHTAKFFIEILLAIVMKKGMLINKPIYVGLSILELRKILRYEFWYGYVKHKYGEKNKNVLYEYRQFHCIHKNR